MRRFLLKARYNGTVNSLYLEVAVSLARQAGEIGRTFFATARERSWKSDNTPVTAADIAINELVIQVISQKFPDHAVLGEEVSNAVASAEYVWVCDPIDGTIPFALGIPTCAFSLGLVRGGVTEVAVAYDFNADRLYTATRGGGAFVNGEPLKAFAADTLRASVTDVEGLWWQGFPVGGLTELPTYLEREGSKILKVCSMVYAGLLVAQGELAGMISRGDKPWDVAALDLIVREAGGRVTNLLGEPLRCDQPIQGCIVCGAGVHETYLRLVAEAMAEP